MIVDELLDEERNYDAELPDKPHKALDLLIKLQSIVANLQEAIGRQVRINVILEERTAGYNLNIKCSSTLDILRKINSRIPRGCSCVTPNLHFLLFFLFSLKRGLISPF